MSDFLLSIGYRSWALDMLMALPLAAALIVLLSRAEHAKWIALWVTLAEFVISSGLWWAFEPGTAAMQFEVRHAWIPDWGITYYLGVDGISLFMVLLTTFTMPLAVLGSFNYIKQHERSYYALLLVLTTGMLGVFVALDLFVFYVFWEIMLIPMYFIIGVWGGGRRLYAAIKFFIFTFVGSLLMLVAILTIYYVVGRDTLCIRPPAAEHRPGPAVGGLAVWRFRTGVCHQGADVPVPHMAAGRPCGGPDRGLSHPGRYSPQNGDIWIPEIRRSVLPASRSRPNHRGDHCRAVSRRHHLRRARGARTARFQKTRRILVR
jgi:hypothetical protein